MSSDWVRCAVQDGNGFILFGTDEGQSRFDNRFDPAACGSFPKIVAEPSTDRFGVLLPRDHEGAAWAGANGLYRLDTMPPGRTFCAAYRSRSRHRRPAPQSDGQLAQLS